MKGSVFSGYPVKVMILLGGLSLSLLVYSYYSWRLVVVEQTPLLDAIMQVKVDLVDSHAKLMELLENRHMELNKQDVSEPLSRAAALTHEASTGDVTVGDVGGELLDDSELGTQLITLSNSIQSLRTHLQPWLQSKSADRNSLGEAHDQLYTTAMQHAERCDKRIHEVVHETLGRQQQIFMLLLLVWCGSLALVWWKWLAVNRLHNRATEKLCKLSQAVDQAGEFIMITDNHGTVEYVNPAFSRISGFSDGEIMGQHLSLLVCDKEGESFFKYLIETILEGREWHGEFVARRKSGECYPAMMSISPIRNSEEKVSHYVVIQQDISEHEALQEQLRQSMKMESVGTLAGGIAHDFNNILAGFMGNIFLMRSEVEESAPALKRLETLEQLSQSAAGMVSQLLTFARKDVVRMQPFEFSSFFDTAIELARTAVPASVDFTYKNCTDGIQVLGSDNQLQQVLINLIANANHAVKRAEHPAIQVSAEAYVADETFMEKHPDVTATEFVRLSVADNGYGIPQAQIKNIFEPFFTTKEVGHGTGLGLSMVYGAIQGHGGVIEVESEEGVGSTFTIYLLQQAWKLKEVCSEVGNIVRGRGETILLVDDDLQVLETHGELLKAFGYIVLKAHNGLEALDVFTANQDEIELVIMDCVMPGMGGAKAAKRIYRKRPDAKIIFMTGYDNEDTLDEELVTPQTQVLFKPCRPDKLSWAIRKGLDSDTRPSLHDHSS